MTRAVPQAAIDLVKQVEGLRLTAYQDVAGVWTIGYGHANADAGVIINAAQAAILLQEDLQTAAERLAGVVDEAVILILTDNQYSALLSFVFNLGANPSWTIWKVLNAKQFDQVPAQLIRFVYAGNPPVKVQGLVNRRTAEINLWSLDEPGSVDTSPSSSVTRATATPAVPIDPAPKGIAVLATAAVTTVAAAVPQLQGAVQAVSDAVTPYRDSAAILGHVASALAVGAAGLAVAALGFKYLRDRQSKAWGKTSAPALHPTVLASERNLLPTPPGTTVAPVPSAGLVGGAAVASQSVAPSTAQPAVGGAGSTITADLAALRDSLARCLGKITGEAQALAGKTVSEIVAEAKKLAAAVESKL